MSLNMPPISEYRVRAEEHEENQQPRALRGDQHRNEGQRERPRQEQQAEIISVWRETTKEEAIAGNERDIPPRR